MDIKSLTAELSASKQILPEDMQAIKNAGFRAIICNRPDGEGADQPTFEEISKAAQAAGLLPNGHPIRNPVVACASRPA